MKKMLAAAMCAAVLLSSLPVSAGAYSDDRMIINKHGSGTYMGPEDAWSQKSWDSRDFTEVTGEDVVSSDDVIIKGGKVGSVTVSNGCSLTIYDGTASDVDCSGSIYMTGGTVNSLESDDGISISGGTVRSDVHAQESVTLSGKLTVGGNVSANNITVYATSGNTTNVYGGFSFPGKMTMQGTSYNFGPIDGQLSGTLLLKNFSGKLPACTNLGEIDAGPGTVVTTGESMDIDSLKLEENSVFSTTSTLKVETLQGPGTLSANPGSLTVGTAISDYPVLDFYGTVTDGTTVFQAKSGAVAPSSVTVFGYGLTKQESSSGYDSFVLRALTGNGVTLDTSSVTLPSGGYATVKATVNPNPSGLVSGSKLHWKLIDPTSKFSISDSSDATCRIYLSSSAGTGTYQARLAVYLVDNDGDILMDYKSASCALSSGATVASTGSGITLDTSNVTIPTGRTYSVLAITNSSTAPSAMSYNSAVAVVGKPVKYSYNGKSGWLYPVKAVAKGGVTIDIGGQKMLVTV